MPEVANLVTNSERRRQAACEEVRLGIGCSQLLRHSVERESNHETAVLAIPDRSYFLQSYGNSARSIVSLTGASRTCREEDKPMTAILQLWADDEGQDIAEYAVMLAVILVLVVGTIRLVGSNANNAFSSVSS